MKPTIKPKFKTLTLPTIAGLSPTETGAPEGGFILSVRGTDSSGKSDFAARACKSKLKGYYAIDPGADRVIRKYKKLGYPILAGDFNYEKPPTFVVLPKDSKDKKSRDWWKDKGQEVRDEAMDPFLESWRAAYRNDEMRVMVQDTATEFYEMMMLAHFGKVTQNEQREYGALYADYLGPIKAAKAAGKLVILIHQMKDNYVPKMQSDGTMKDTREGLKRAGCSRINFIMDGEIETRHTNEERKKRGGKWEVTVEEAWEVEIVNCKHDPSKNGTVLDNPSFEEVMAIMAPTVRPEFWE